MCMRACPDVLPPLAHITLVLDLCDVPHERNEFCVVDIVSAILSVRLLLQLVLHKQ